MTTFVGDLWQAKRALLRAPGFTSLVVLLVAIATGASTAVFTIVNAVMLRPLPFPDSHRIVDISLAASPEDSKPGRRLLLDSQAIEVLRERTEAFEAVAAYSSRTVTSRSGNEPRRLEAAAVSAGFFEALGVRPALGRPFYRADEYAGAEPVVILSHGMWLSSFGGDTRVLGSSVTLDALPHVVVGVMPPGFVFPPVEVDLWVPLSLRSSYVESGDAIERSYLPVIARLREGAPLTRAQAETEAILRRVSSAVQGEGSGARARVVPLQDALAESLRPALRVLCGAVAFLLLSACVNLGSLFSVRCFSRRREIAIRLALGGRRSALIRALLAESLLVTVAGGTLGVVLATWTNHIMPALLPGVLGGGEWPAPDARVFAFALLVCTVIAVFSGLAPAARDLRVVSATMLRSGAAERAALRSRHVLIGGQIALAFGLLVAAGLLGRSFLNLLRVDLGFDPSHLLTMRVELDARDYGGNDRAVVLFERLLERIGGHEAVHSAGVVSTPPITSRFSLKSVSVVGEPPMRSLAVHQLTSPGYFSAMRFSLAEGRWLGRDDHDAGTMVAVVNEAFADRYIRGGSAVGRQVEVGSAVLRIVGIVRNTRLLGPAADARPEIYTSFRLRGVNDALGSEGLTIAIRTTGEAAAMAAFLRSVMHDLDPNLPVGRLRTMEATVASVVAKPRTYAVLVGLFAAIAVGLAAAGTYGSLSFDVARQTRTIAIRRALGARPREILRDVLSRGLLMVVVGLFGGVLLSLGTRGSLSQLLFRVSPDEAITYIGALGLFALLGTLACYVAARRAMAVEPIEVLRSIDSAE